MITHFADIVNLSDPYGEVIVLVVAIISLFKLIEHVINGNDDKRK